MTTLHFLLTPDRSSARRLRRIIAEKGGRIGVLVGTWPELVEQARESYLLPVAEDWDEALAAAAKSMKNAFWAMSLEVAPDETIAEISRALAMLIEGAGPERQIEPGNKNVLTERASRHLADLALLHEKVAFALPSHLAAINSLLKADNTSAIRSIVVYHHENFPELTSWQQALISKLEKDAVGLDRDKQLESLLRQSFEWPGAESTSSLGALQRVLFEPSSEPVKLDDSAQWLACRDYLEEAEVAAGMVQQALKIDTTLKLSDIGILVPDDPGYSAAVSDAFTLAGILLSGLNSPKQVRDIGREAAFYFALSRRRPAPAMALAALYSNPLMPWSPVQGTRLAQNVMDGEYELKLSEEISPQTAKMLKLLNEEVKTCAQLRYALKIFAGLISGSDDFRPHLDRARQALEGLEQVLPDSGEIPWADLISRIHPVSVNAEKTTGFTQEGICVFGEHEEPWRNVRLLIVFGFSEERYPAETGRSSVFFESDLEILKNKMSYGISLASDIRAERRRLFKRQLSSASERALFFIPQRDMLGAALQPSETLTFMTKLFKNIENPEDLIAILDSEAGRNKAMGIALAPEAEPTPPRMIKVVDLHFDQDLLGLRVDENGRQIPESPSRLETLMVSSLGWILDRSEIVPFDWTPEALNQASKGTLAHAVFEQLFQAGDGFPSVATIKNKIPEILNKVIIQKMPFMLTSEWRVERNHLAADIETAALRWREILTSIKGKIIGTEVKLLGQLGDLPLHGNADVLVSLPGNRLYVVDYKKAKSQSRRKRMKLGYESQASLYRIMIETGGASDGADKKLKNALAGVKEIGILYYLMNDQVVLTDSSQWTGRTVAGFEEMGTGISKEALALIRKKIAEVRQGVVTLNCEDDEKTFEKQTGIPCTYAFDISPLITLFMHPGEEARI